MKIKITYLAIALAVGGCVSDPVAFQHQQYAQARACQAAIEDSRCDSTKACLVQVRHQGNVLTCRR